MRLRGVFAVPGRTAADPSFDGAEDGPCYSSLRRPVACPVAENGWIASFRCRPHAAARLRAGGLRRRAGRTRHRVADAPAGGGGEHERLHRRSAHAGLRRRDLRGLSAEGRCGALPDRGAKLRGRAAVRCHAVVRCGVLRLPDLRPAHRPRRGHPGRTDRRKVRLAGRRHRPLGAMERLRAEAAMPRRRHGRPRRKGPDLPSRPLRPAAARPRRQRREDRRRPPGGRPLDRGRCNL